MEAKKLPVRFPNIVRKYIYSAAEELDLSPSVVSRAAMLLGIMEIKGKLASKDCPDNYVALIKGFGSTGSEEN